MSTHYDLMPLADMAALPKQRLWLETMGLSIPDDWENSRDPTAAEVRSVIQQMADENQIIVETKFCVAGGDLDMTVGTEQDSTVLSVENYAVDCDEDAPRHLSFQGGEPELVVPICGRLTRVCGPFLLTNNGAFFVIVNVGITPAKANWVADDF